MNALFFAKVMASAVIIGVAVEVAKRNPFWGAVIIALLLTSILAMGWLYADTRNDMLVTKFARDVFVVVPVSLVFFMPFLLESKTRLGFIANYVPRPGIARHWRLGAAPDYSLTGDLLPQEITWARR